MKPLRRVPSWHERQKCYESGKPKLMTAPKIPTRKVDVSFTDKDGKERLFKAKEHTKAKDTATVLKRTAGKSAAFKANAVAMKKAGDVWQKLPVKPKIGFLKFAHNLKKNNKMLKKKK